MKIRLARDEDYVVIARLHRQTIRQVNKKDYNKEQIRVWSGRTSTKRFRESAHMCKRWVALDTEKVIGFADHPLDKCVLWGLFVHKDYIGKSVGSKLIKKVEASLLKQGCKNIKIESTITAKEFYKKQGYKVRKKSFHQFENQKVETYILSKKIK
ncbi:MAG: GNAT family N-acetyltransferase [Candidatus Magasanikbacteria bacterium]